jgi:hemerythrin
MNSDIHRRVAAIQGLALNSLRDTIGWRDDFRVGESSIDSQHESIFRLAVEACELAREPADSGSLIAVFAKFGSVLGAHFRHEEGMLTEICYPKLAEHRGEHRAMLSEFEFIHQRLSSGGRAWVFQEKALVVINFMLGVTVGHILASDVGYARYMRRDASPSG